MAMGGPSQQAHSSQIDTGPLRHAVRGDRMPRDSGADTYTQYYALSVMLCCTGFVSMTSTNSII